MVAALFEVDADDVKRLDDKQLAHICNRLLRAEAHIWGIPQFCIETTENVDIGDGGIDAKVECALELSSNCRIPNGLSIWQYKSGNVEPADVRAEFAKPDVQEALNHGASYYFIASQDLNSKTRRPRREVFEDCFKKLGLEPKGLFLTQTDIVEWILEFPAITLHRFFKHISIHDNLYTFEEWAALPQLRTSLQFRIDAERQKFITSLGEAVNTSEYSQVRLTGQDGSGKTRLVLEAISANQLQDLTLYAANAEAIPDELFRHIANKPSHAKSVLIVDSCSEQQMRELANMANRCGSRVMLVTIGNEAVSDDEQPTDIWRYNLEPLNQNMLIEIIGEFSIHEDLKFHVARSTQKNVKLAIALADAIHRNPNVKNVADISQKGSLLDVIFFDGEERQAMQALSILKFVGLYNRATEIGKIVAEFVGITITTLKTVAHKMEKRGLVVRHGDICRITPRFLAVQLATELWQSRSDDIKSDLYPALKKLNSEALLLQRLADLGNEQFANSFVEDLFNIENELSSIEKFDKKETVHNFSILVSAAPKATIRNFSRLMKATTNEQLSKFSANRSVIISALGNGILFEETFYEAAYLIRRFAEVEISQGASDGQATRLWCSIFQTYLPIGTIPALERHQLLDEALTSTNPSTRLLAIKAILTAGTPFLESRGVGIEVGGHILAEHWQPQTNKEVFDIWRSAFTKLDLVINDPVPEIADEARKLLLMKSSFLISYGLVEDVLPRIERYALKPQSEKEKKELYDTLRNWLDHHSDKFNEEQLNMVCQWLEGVFTNSYQDKFRRWLGELSNADRKEVFREHRHAEFRDTIVALAQEGFHDTSLLEPELAWLNSISNATNAITVFGMELGRLDEKKGWFAPIIQALAILNATPYLLSAYLQGRFHAGDRAWVEDCLAQFASKSSAFADVVFYTVLNLGFSEPRLHLVLQVVDKGWLPSGRMGSFIFNSWMQNISASLLELVLRRMIDDTNLYPSAAPIELLSYWLDNHPNEAGSIAEYAFEILGNPSLYNDYILQRVASFYMNTHVERLAQTILNHAALTYTAQAHDDLWEVLNSILQNQPIIVWPILGEALLSQRIWLSRTLLRGGTKDNLELELLDPDLLITWASQYQPESARILAGLVKVEPNLSPLTRQLLFQWRDDEEVIHGVVGGFTEFQDPISLEEKKVIAQNWLKDQDLSVRKWANEVLVDLERISERWKYIDGLHQRYD